MSKRILRRSSLRVICCVTKRDSSTSAKLTSSYYHNVSSVPLIHKTLGQVFDETAKKYPEHECFVFKGERKRYTYKSFQDEVDSIAASLLELGLEKSDRIAVWLPNTSENVTMSFVASKLGLIKVNINPAYVERELEYCLNKVGCKALVLAPTVKSIQSLAILRQLLPELDQSSSFKRVPSLEHIILTGKSSSTIPKSAHSYEHLLKHGAKISHSKLQLYQSTIDPHAPLAIFYTSGTTGQPKAATLTNFNMINMSQNISDHVGKYFTRLCAPIPMFHIFSEAVGVCNPLVAKRQTVFPAILPDPVATMRAIDEDKCTSLIGAPVIFRDILNHLDRKKYNLSSLEYSALGASPVHVDFLRQLEQEIPIQRVGQVYGMTENCAILSSSMWAADGDTRRYSSIGRAMQHIEMKVVDQEGNTVPVGESGEIWARGFPIMSGYYNDTDKTRETVTESGWLRTGDEGRMDEDGFLYFIGRQKDIIIRGGVNIYPIEIEKAIMEHPSVAEAQVFSIPDVRHDEEICAWIKLKSDAARCQPEDMVKFLSTKLAFFKIPKHIRFVDKFIVTATGKAQKFKMTQSMIDELNKN
ncbi:unnamed protein product [Adineta ricciae]|uniref:Medium-chain acyl-CoA ligase ACSF2, mitochondrial n=1 Tax=Adineta ricciae TaxID=249248 RepID=A0A815Z223_ADIRI|nr:unnamed protein product [Adineta ricciae]